MRSILSLIILMFISLASVEAQIAIDNQIFRKIKNESYDGALKYGHKKLEKLKDSKNYYKKAIPYYLGLGMVYKKMGNYREAEKNYHEAGQVLEYKEKNKLRKKIVDYDVLDEMAMMYLEIGNFYEAEDLIKKSIATREKRFDKTNLLRYRSDLVYGNYFFRTNQPDSAYKYFKKYIFYIKNSRHTSKEELNRYADTYMYLTEMELKRNNATQALVFAKKNKHLQFHKWTRKEAGKNNLNKINSFNLLSESYRYLGNLVKAEKNSKMAFKYYNKVIKEENYHLVPLLMNRGFIYWNKGDLKNAQSDFMKASKIQSKFIDENFKSLSEYEKENFYAFVSENFDVLNSFAVDQKLNHSESADSIWNVIYDFQIKTKAIILNESNRMLQAIQASNDQDLIEQFNEWKKLKNELSMKVVVYGFDQNDQSVKKIQYSINHLEKEMSNKTALFKENIKEPSWNDIKNKLKPSEAAVEVIRVNLYGDVKLNNTAIKKYKNAASNTKGLSDSIVYVFLSVSNQSSHPDVFFIDGSLLEGKNYKYYHNTKLYKIDDNQSYNYFWKPIGEKLKGYNTIYLSSDGVYNLINPWILKNPTTGKYLIDEVNIVNVTNTKQIIHMDEKEFKASSAILIGRPNYFKADSLNQNNIQEKKNNDRGINQFVRGGINDLPGTEVEVKNISNYLDQNKVSTKVLVWNHATEESLKGSNSNNIIHIATHGFFNPQSQGSPMLRAGLLLAGVSSVGNKEEDGILTAYEASNLDLSNTHLVVLSACETGLGEVKEGEGVYGLQRAFEVAGVDAIMMSMWKVNDQTTQELMVAFYEELLNTKSVLVAFRKAQLKIRTKYPEPLYWGAFKLIGK